MTGDGEKMLRTNTTNRDEIRRDEPCIALITASTITKSIRPKRGSEYRVSNDGQTDESA